MNPENRIVPEDREDCGAFLRRYASDQRRLTYLNGLIPLLRQRLRDLRMENPYAAIRVTAGWEGPAVRAVRGDPTAAVAVRAADSAFREEVRRTEQKLRSVILEREQLQLRIARADCYLNALREDERFLIEARVIQDMTWTQVEDGFETRFGVRYHRDTLRRRLSGAVRTLNEVASGG